MTEWVDDYTEKNLRVLLIVDDVERWTITRSLFWVCSFNGGTDRKCGNMGFSICLNEKLHKLILLSSSYTLKQRGVGGGVLSKKRDKKCSSSYTPIIRGCVGGGPVIIKIVRGGHKYSGFFFANNNNTKILRICPI